MLKKEFEKLSVTTNNAFLYQKLKDYDAIGDFTEMSVNILSIQMINTTSAETLIDSFADYQTSGAIHAKLSFEPSLQPLKANKEEDQAPTTFCIFFIMNCAKKKQPMTISSMGC